jgi:5-methylcytosine-specific restriction endonuclease McrBC regulatory subunit McrC
MDRRSRYYASAIELARHIIIGNGRTIEHGSHSGWTFLIRTPEMVEEGIRSLLRRRLGGRWAIGKQGRQLVGSPMTFNPDLVFDRGLAIGDVKYKWLSNDWVRADLYQSIAFAVAFNTGTAALIGFRSTPSNVSRALRVGKVVVHELTWLADHNVTPAKATDLLVAETERWLLSAGNNHAIGLEISSQ